MCDPKYADVVVRRWEDWTGKKAIRISDQTPETSEVCQKVEV
jgi:hypothetical protein